MHGRLGVGVSFGIAESAAVGKAELVHGLLEGLVLNLQVFDLQGELLDLLALDGHLEFKLLFHLDLLPHQGGRDAARAVGSRIHIFARLIGV